VRIYIAIEIIGFKINLNKSGDKFGAKYFIKYGEMAAVNISPKKSVIKNPNRMQNKQEQPQ
jgi:hypothetical protein